MSAESSKEKPLLADLVMSGDEQISATKINDFIYMVKDISNAYLVRTSDGDVLINTGFMDNAGRNKDLLSPHQSGPLRHIILTQSHADHFGGVPVFREAETTIIGGTGFDENWADMRDLQPFFAPRSAKLWASTLKRGNKRTPPPDINPDVIVENIYTFDQGGRRFECLHTPEGETTDGLSVRIPNEGIVFTGNLFGPVFRSMPFLNTIRGDKPRSVRTYLSSLRRVRALEPELLITGHGDPIKGKKKIRADLDKLHDAVTFVQHATLEGMNAGKSVHELMDEIKLPDNLIISENHGKVSWAVKAIWHEYSGWFMYVSTTELYGVARSHVDADLADLSGGADALAQRAQTHVEGKRPLEAIHLIDIALGAAPDNEKALRAKRDAHRQLLETSGSENLSEMMWLKSEIEAADEKLKAIKK